MPFSQRTRYLLVLLTVVLAAGVELAFKAPRVIVIPGALGFLLAGFATVYRAGAAQRKIRRKQRMDYWTNNDAT